MPPASGSRERRQPVGVSRERQLLSTRQPLHRVLDSERETAISTAPGEEQLEEPAAAGVPRALAGVVGRDAGGYV